MAESGRALLVASCETGRALLVVSRRDRSERSPGLPRKEEPVLAGFELSPTAPLDDR